MHADCMHWSASVHRATTCVVGSVAAQGKGGGQTRHVPQAPSCKTLCPSCAPTDKLWWPWPKNDHKQCPWPIRNYGCPLGVHKRGWESRPPIFEPKSRKWNICKRRHVKQTVESSDIQSVRYSRMYDNINPVLSETLQLLVSSPL